jgi:acetylornithine/N-succinyldiaminopimelate aminotransferase
MGRTGDLFAHQRWGVTPDVMPVAKGIGGGFPLGACLATAEAAEGMTAGTHGSTFGGNPLAMAAGNAVLDVLLEPGFLEKVRRTGLLLKQRLAELKDRHSGVIAEVRGEGFLLGLRAVGPSSEFVDALRAEKLLTVPAGDNVVRLLPPLISGAAEISQAVAMIDRAATRLGRMREGRGAEGAVG